MTEETGADPGPGRTRVTGKSAQGAALRAADAYRIAPAAVETGAPTPRTCTQPPARNSA